MSNTIDTKMYLEKQKIQNVEFILDIYNYQGVMLKSLIINIKYINSNTIKIRFYLIQSNNITYIKSYYLDDNFEILKYLESNDYIAIDNYRSNNLWAYYKLLPKIILEAI